MPEGKTVEWVERLADPARAAEVAEKHGVSEPLARAMVARGFVDDGDITSYLSSSLKDITDPFSIAHMEDASQRLWQAVQNGEKILIYGDYDCDGVTSVAVLARFLKGIGHDAVAIFIPSRLDDGYGLISECIKKCFDEHSPSLVVTVDCGVNSREEVELIKSLGVDVIVTDHHEPDEVTCEPTVLVNPKLDSPASMGDLAGVGVAFKLAHALVKRGRELKKPTAIGVELRHYLDIVALGTVADIVPLLDENRILVRHGLEQLGVTKWAGLQALKTVAGVKGEPDTFHLGFQLGPRINAAGRIGQPMQALQLLTTASASEAQRIAKLLDETNTERRRIEREMADAAFEEIDAYFNPKKNFGLVVAKKGWHPGVVGIVASRVSRHYNRPAIIMGIEDDGSARGSCRSIQEYNVLDGLQVCKEHLNKFGGHKMAAGLEVKPGNLELFKSAFNAAAVASLAGQDLAPVQQIDAIMTSEEINRDFFDQLKQLRPFGQDNPEPVWGMLQVEVAAPPRVVGETHLKLTLVSNRLKFEAIAFNYPIKQLPAGKLDIAFTLKENTWRGNTSLQLQIQDIRAAKKLG